MLPFGSNLYNNGIIDERNSVSVIDEGNFLRPVYPKRLDISYEQIETVLNQINNEINISGLTISMTDYKTFNLLFNPGDRIHRRIQAGLGDWSNSLKMSNEFNLFYRHIIPQNRKGSYKPLKTLWRSTMVVQSPSTLPTDAWGES